MSRKATRAPATPATRALEAAGVGYESLPYRHDPTAASYGLEAAHVLGLDPEHVFKTLVVELDTGAHGVCVLPVSRSANLKAVAAALGAKKAVMAAPADVTRLTGYVLGGVSPLGQRTRLPTVIDVSARGLGSMYVSGGRRGFDVGLCPADLARLTGAGFAAITRDHGG